MSLAAIVSTYSNFFFDLDGVIWECESLLPGVKSLFSLLESQSKRIYFVSNNAIRSRRTFLSLFSSLSIPADPDNIICAGFACASYLLSTYPLPSKIFVIGSEGLIEEISSAGYEVVSSLTMDNRKLTTTQLGLLSVDPDIQAVVVGYTPRLNFYMLSYALNCIKKGARLITGNYDCTDKFGKYNVPGCACTVEFLRYAIQTDFVNVGKPEVFMMDKIMQRDGLDRETCIVFGDKMATDILLAKNAGIASALVLTGVERVGTFEGYEYQPDYVLSNLVLDS